MKYVRYCQKRANQFSFAPNKQHLFPGKSALQVSKKFNIPSRTLYDKVGDVIYLSIYSFIYLSISLSLCPSFYMAISLIIFLFISRWEYVNYKPIHLVIYLSILLYPSIYLSISQCLGEEDGDNDWSAATEKINEQQFQR